MFFSRCGFLLYNTLLLAIFLYHIIYEVRNKSQKTAEMAWREYSLFLSATS
jgi:hypothetical protein